MKQLYLYIFFFLTAFVSSTNGQNVFELKGKKIVLSGFRFPFENQKTRGLYSYESFGKKSFSKKHFISNKIDGLKANVLDVVVINEKNEKKRAVVMNLSLIDTIPQKAVIYIPCYYVRILSNGGLFPEAFNPTDLSLYFYSIDKINNANRLMANKKFYFKNNKKLCVFKEFKLYGGDLFAHYYREGDGLCKENFRSDEELSSFLQGVVLEDDLIARCKSKYKDYYIDSIKTKFLDKEVYYTAFSNLRDFYHCDSIYMGIFNDTKMDYSYLMRLSNNKNHLTIKIDEKEFSEVELASEKRERERLEEEIKEREAKEQQEIEAREEEIYRSQLIKKYGKNNAHLILEGEVRIGFTKAMCIESWGEPSRINRTTTKYGTLEQWVYGYGNYLYFEGNRLTGIQDH